MCSACSTGTLTLQEGKASKAFAVHLQLVCTSCGTVDKEISTTKKTGHVSDVNRSVVATGLTCGIGHAGIQKLSEGLGMPGIHHKSYLDHVDSVFDKTPEVAEVVLTLSREKVRQFYREHLPDSFTPDGVLDLPVSFDGSWPKRGHTSKLGFGAVVDVHTGLVVDFHVMSLHCQVGVFLGSFFICSI